MDHAAAFRAVYERILGLVDESSADVEVPTCPGWTVNGVIAHLAGFFTTFRSGDPREVFDQDWGDRVVAERKDHSLDENLKELGDIIDDADDVFGSQMAMVAVADALAHEQDIRTALGKPGATDDENIVAAVQMGLSFAGRKAEKAGLPALRIVTEDIDQQIGSGEPVATLRTSTFELFRTIHGRRTPDQLRALDWTGDPGPWIPGLFLFGPAESVVEQSAV
jgi:uncharacterized protein (TIGR03083 family)